MRRKEKNNQESHFFILIIFMMAANSPVNITKSSFFANLPLTRGRLSASVLRQAYCKFDQIISDENKKNTRTNHSGQVQSFPCIHI
jgi:hypothetical protein